MLAGLILRVSYESARRDEYDRRRESFAVMGMALWAEYLDGIAVITVNPAAAKAAANTKG